jgi:hypothetical protein
MGKSEMESKIKMLTERITRMEQALMSKKYEGSLFEDMHFLIQNIKGMSEYNIKQRAQVQQMNQSNQIEKNIFAKFVKEKGLDDEFTKFFSAEYRKMSPPPAPMKEEKKDVPEPPKDVEPNDEKEDQEVNQQPAPDNES